MSRYVYISKNYRHCNSGGDKAKTDVESILEANCRQNIGLKQSRSENEVKAYLHTLASVLKGVRSLRPGDTLLLQYPLKKYYDYVVDKALAKGVKVVTLIHDLGCFRRKRLSVDEEIKRLNRSAVLMVHTEEMAQWLREHGICLPIVTIGLWDYLSEAEPRESTDNRPDTRIRLTYAGDLSPQVDRWLYKLAADAPELELILYGKGFDASLATPNMPDCGFRNSDSLVSEIQGDFGVVWYGNSLDEVDGPIGEYLPYCASHKTSLYLRAGIPVIIWEKAALADVLVKLGVGVAVGSLRDIDVRLKAISADEYAKLRARAADIGRKIGSGYFLNKALTKIPTTNNPQPINN